MEESGGEERKEDVRWAGGAVAPPPGQRSPFAPQVFGEDSSMKDRSWWQGQEEGRFLLLLHLFMVENICERFNS